jgi:YD repeat-containing protein
VATSVYDAANRLTSRQFNDGAGAVLRFDTAYTARNQISTLTRYSNLAGTTQVGLTSYAYDAVGRETVLQQVNGSSSTFQTTSYSYDLAGRMTAEKLNGSTASYSYDSANQLTASGTATFAYDAAGNRTSGGSTPSSGDQISQDANYTYSYDADGNRTGKTSRSDGSSWVYTYNAADQLISATNYDSSSDLLSAVTYLYDAWGNMIERDEYDAPPTLGSGGGGDMAMAGFGGADSDIVEPGLTITRYGQDGWKVS